MPLSRSHFRRAAGLRLSGQSSRSHARPGPDVKSLRGKILLTSVALVLVCQLVTVVTVLVQAHREAGRQAHATLDVAGGVVRSYLEGRQAQLHATVRVLANDYGFRSAVASHDAETVRSVLRNHVSRIQADYAVLFDTDGHHVTATTDDAPALSQLALVGGDGAERGAPLFVQQDGNIYQSVIVAVMAPVHIGWVAMGFALDEPLAKTLSELTGTRVTFRAGNSAPDAAIATDDYVSILPLPTKGVPIHARLELHRSVAMGAFQSLAQSLVVLAGLAVCLTGLVALGLSRNLTRPLMQLLRAARRIGQGDYTTAVSVGTSDEIGELAETVTTMQGRIREREHDIRYQADHDALTGLPNRQALLHHLTRCLMASPPVEVLVITVRGVHELTSTLGLELGDAVVQALARQLTEGFGNAGFVARIADARFCLVVAGVEDPADTARAADVKLLLEARPAATTPPVSVKVSVGVALSSAGDTNATALLRRAWMASLQAEQGSQQIALYDASGDEAIARRRRIVEELERVNQQDGLYVVYQPRYDTATSEFVSVEALLRWQHPELGLIPPDQFIPLAERANCIGRITRLVLEETTDQLLRWQARGLALRASVNVSARDVSDPAFPLFVMSLLDRKGLDPRLLELEITETALASDPDTMANCLRVLGGLGVELAIDDFGTGFSSLSQLKKLPVHRLKIDRSFVMKLAGAAEDQLMVRSIIALARGMKLAVVAEGVEDTASAGLLRAWGCEELQGYLFSRPMRPELLEEMMLATDSGRRCLEPELKPRLVPAASVAQASAMRDVVSPDAVASVAREPGPAHVQRH
jgi:diguanylate cyclase (GGDEF)-like protein